MPSSFDWEDLKDYETYLVNVGIWVLSVDFWNFFRLLPINLKIFEALFWWIWRFTGALAGWIWNLKRFVLWVLIFLSFVWLNFENLRSFVLECYYFLASFRWNLEGLEISLYTWVSLKCIWMDVDIVVVFLVILRLLDNHVDEFGIF